MSETDKKAIQDYLEGQILMSVATFGEHLWAATVYFVNDEDLNLYFISPPDSQHSRDIAQNKEVACIIADSRQPAAGDKVGLQIYGTAGEEGSVKKLRWMLDMYNKLHPSTRDKFSFDNFRSGVMTSKVYKVKPRRIKFFNTKLFEPSKTFDIGT